jgi:Amt family ammonium transporter
METVDLSWSTMGLNLPDNAESPQQREILDALPALIFLERVGKIVFANRAALQLMGIEGGEWIPRPVEEVLWGLFPGAAEPLPPGDAPVGSPFHATIPARDGRLFTVEGTYSLLHPEMRIAVIVAQESGRERAPKSRLMEEVLASIPEAVAIVHENHILYTNPAFTRLFGFTAEEVAGGDLRKFIVPETRQHESGTIEHTVEQEGHASLETVRVNKNGDLIDVALAGAPLQVNGARLGYVFSFRDIAERKQVEAKLQHDAMHDLLTGLPNRALFLDRLKLALNRRSRRRDQSCGVFFLDLDRFKEINDSLGHAAGDVVLVMVAERLRTALRPQDTAARLGGDEFAILVESILSLADLDLVAGRILREMERPFEFYGNSVAVGASIGVAMAGPDHVAPELILRDADFAMYRAKQEGGGRYEIFDKTLKLQVSNQLERERELRQALDKREFEVWYHPIFRLQSGKLEGFESQLRWRHEDGMVGSFDELLAVAEETGLSITLGRETIETVCRRVRDWNVALPHAELSLTVNLTQRQFFHSELLAQLKRTLAVSGVNPEQIMFEVAETTLNENPEAARGILQQLVDCDVRVAIDEFGSKLAPLGYLEQMPIDVVKLHAQLTVSATAAGRRLAIAESIVRLGRTLGIQMVAQGIETVEQLNALTHLGCELGQGPLLSPPLDAAQAQQLCALGFWAQPPRK